MKFSEIKDGLTNDINKLNELKIDTYLPLSEKMYILIGTEEEPGMVSNVLDNENGLWYINRFKYQMYLVYNTLVFFGNIEMDVEFDNDIYDWIMENNVYDYVVERANEDYYRMTDLLDDLLRDELEKRNSISAVINRLGTQLLEKLNELTDTDKMEKMIALADDALKRNPELKNIIGDSFKQVKKGGKKKVK